MGLFCCGSCIMGLWYPHPLQKLFSEAIVWLSGIQIDAWQCCSITLWRQIYLAFHIDAGSLPRDYDPNTQPNFIPNTGGMECIVLDPFAGRGCSKGLANGTCYAS